MKQLLVLALSLAQALGEMVPAPDGGGWHLDGQSTEMAVAYCPQFKKALLLHPGASASYMFNGTSIAVWVGMYEDGADGRIEFEGQHLDVSAKSRKRECASFAQFGPFDASKPHTIRISVPGGGKKSVFPLMAVEVGSPLGTIPPPANTPNPTPTSASTLSPPHGEPTADPTSDPTSSNSESTGSSSSSSREPIVTSSTSSSDNGGEAAGTDTGAKTPDPSSSYTLTPSNNTSAPSIDQTETISSLPSGPNSSPNSDTDDQPSFASTSSGPKASTIVPAVFVPLLVIGGVLFALWWMRRRRRARIPPSAAFRMANPGYGESGETMTEARPGWSNGAGGGERQVWSPMTGDHGAQGERY